MLKRIFIFMILVLSINLIFAADVNLSINVGNLTSTFDYTISFNDNESYDSFSLEKPKYSTMISVKDGYNNSQFYLVAGDYFIIRTNKSKNQKFEIKFETKTTSEAINSNNKFKTYINFNFPVKDFDLKVNFSQKYNTVDEIFPREYSILDDGRFEWTEHNLERDSLFLINFKDKVIQDDNSTFKLIDKYMVIFIIISTIFLIVFLFSIKRVIKIVSEKSKNEKIILNKPENKNNNNNNNNSENNENNNNNDGGNSNENNLNLIEEENNETFEEFISKYLTENEKEVVLVIVDNEGLLQNEILNFIPHMKKSNLSKIITKLHSRRILNRIRVGKVNKIHIGSKLKVILDKEKEN